MKFHMMMHLPEWLERLVTCWALERHHKVVKRFMECMPNTSIHYDKSILREATCHHVEVLKSMQAGDFFDVGLIHATAPCPPIIGLFETVFGTSVALGVAHKARCNIYEIVSRGDIVMGAVSGCDFLGRVVEHCSTTTTTTKGVEVQNFTILETWVCKESAATYTRWCTRSPELAMVPLNAILGACTWAMDGEFECVVLRGPRVRRS